MTSTKETGRISGPFSKQLDSAVRKARRNKEWRVEYMLSLLHDWDLKNAGIREGKAEGRREGRREGITAFIRSFRNMDIPEDKIIENLINEFSLSHEEAAELVQSTYDV